MQLTRLDIKGFKSFGDRITINFDKGVTGVVGPNGSGKSNIVDAIRWVLGEQKTRMLRSDKMENVIFNGSKTRKATNVAEVSLSFNNTRNLLPTEYSQVTITRRYFRSGESDYELNGVACRLKDITNLFLDTGIASNSYAIIELKMVDDLLNDKDNSRRALFEEAAGISKFKRRKKETLRKLEDTDADLERVDDLLFEIEKNMKSLEKQARQTENYYKIKEHYKEESIRLAQMIISSQEGKRIEIEKHIQNEEDKKTSFAARISEREAQVEQHKKDLIQHEKLLASRQKTLNEHTQKIRQYESDKQIQNERQRYLNSRTDELKNLLQQDKESLERTGFSLSSLEKELETADQELRESRKNSEALKKVYDAQKEASSQIQKEVESLRQVQKDRQNEVYQLRKNLEIKAIQKTSLEQELDKTTTDTTEQKESLVAFSDKISSIENTLEEKRKQLTKVQKEEEDLNNRIEKTTRTIEVIRVELVQLERKKDARENEYQLTKSLVENLEGFPEAIKFLSKKSGWKKNAPLLSDIMTCDENYRVAIENFLEPYLNYYILEHAEEAYQAINLLSDAAKGKAHFFVLDTFENYKPGSNKIYDNAFPATEIIEYDSRYKKLMSHILDGVYIFDGDPQAIPPDDNTFLSKNGKITRRKYSISGGSVGLFEGKKIGRAKNLEKLEKEIKKLDKQIDEVKRSLEEKSRDLELLKAGSKKSVLEALQEDITRVNNDFISIKTKKEQFGSMLSDSGHKKEHIQEQIANLKKEIQSLEPKVEAEEKVLIDEEARFAALNERLGLETQALGEHSTAYNEANILFHQKENRLRSIAQEISYKKDTYTNTESRITTNSSEVTRIEKEIRDLAEKTSGQDEALIAFYKEKEALEAGLNEAEKAYYALRGNIDTIDKEARDIARQKETTDALIMQFKEKMNEIKLELNSVKERLSIEFNIGRKDLDNMAVPEDDINEEELRARVEKTKARLDNMGPINPMAMEAFNEIKERYDFIIKEKGDLIQAKDSLLLTIKEIDEVARENFITAFDQIKENFVKVFRSLFTDEDDCDLKLIDPDNPLESGIEIMAKPKGKRPISINQLSGGEKTLTATSLLFAIYLLKPAPFCIFDEVDAPLDDANIDKFNNIIRDFSKESQFIIVTHNKRTMTFTDVIYGITMIEQGISKVVPVDLRELV